MTNEEFSNEFDVLYNSITSNQAPGLDEYEKSVFLTKAQSEILREYFNSRVDGTNGGFDGSQKRQYDFSSLITTTSLIESSDTTAQKIDSRSKRYSFPSNYFLSVNEILRKSTTANNVNSKQYSVIPISYSDYQRLMMKPYAYPPKRTVWRLFTNTSGSTSTVPIAEIIGKFETGKTVTYCLRYVKKPSPIILVDLTNDNLSIDGVSTESSCTLPPQLHQEILERAVTLAKLTYQAGTTSTIAQQAQSSKQ